MQSNDATRDRANCERVCRAFTVVAAAILVIGCANPDDWALRSDLPAVVDGPPEDLPDSLVLVGFLGEGIIGDYKGSRAISHSGRIALEEASECRVTVLDLTSGDLLYRVGKCGEGPGEFRAIASVFFDGDTLSVIDGVLDRLTTIAPDGRVLAMQSWKAIWGDLSVSPSGVELLNDTLLLALNRRATRSDMQILLLDRRTHRLVQGFLPQPPATRRRAQAYAYAPYACGVVDAEMP